MAKRITRRVARGRKPVFLPAASYQHDTAKWLIDFAENAYKEEPGPNVQKIEGKPDVEGFIVEESKGVVIAFRGSDNWQDWLTNLLALKSLWTGGEMRLPEVRIHTGFRQAYNNVRTQILDAITAIRPEHVYVTGHSMGGALATLAAFEIGLRATGKWGVPREYDFIKQVTMYNYGSPRVGNAMFAAFYRNAVRDSHRLVVPLDLVTTVPPTGRSLGPLRAAAIAAVSRYIHVPLIHKLKHIPQSEITQLFGRHTNFSGAPLQPYRNQLELETS